MPLSTLPASATLRAIAPLDALCRFCDRHGWHTTAFPPISDPPVPMRGEIRANDRTATAKVLVSPIGTVRSLTKDGTAKHEGTYSVEVVR